MTVQSACLTYCFSGTWSSGCLCWTLVLELCCCPKASHACFFIIKNIEFVSIQKRATCSVLTTIICHCRFFMLISHISLVMHTCFFLRCTAGMIDCPGTQDGSSLRSLIDKPPVCGNSFSPLTGALLTGFRLHTGPVLTKYTTQDCTHTSYEGRYVFSIMTLITDKQVFFIS